MALLLNIINKLFPMLLSFMLMFTGGLNDAFNGEIYAYDSIDEVIGIETLARSQDVTTDGTNWYYSGKNYLEKVSLDNETVLKINMEAIPAELSENYNSQHIGGISYYNGYIYAAVEDSKQWNHPLVVVYDADTLEFTGTFYEMSTERHTRGIPWLLVDGENGILYAGDSSNYIDIFMYDLETMEYIGKLTCSEEIRKIQGGEYYNGKLYLGTNDMTRAVYTVDCKTGEVEKLFDRIMYEYKLIDNLGGEGEGLTVLPMKDGTLIHTLQVGTLFIDSSLRHYIWK
ncbi:MAG: hypothetical protein IJE93_02715 [Clostridia bacterium]|nr:hypothetical protein [Clostridia bacterium]